MASAASNDAGLRQRLLKSDSSSFHPQHIQPTTKSEKPKFKNGKHSKAKQKLYSTDTGKRNWVQSYNPTHKSSKSVAESEELSFILFLVATLVSVWTRFHELAWPHEVVFDEVHFGKFASYYLRRTFYFDVHPPLGRLLIALWGWFIGYGGHFDFREIGDDYISNNVDHYGLRLLPAGCGALVVPLAFLIMKNLRFSLQSCFLTAMFLAFDNGLVTQSRFILLDSMLMLFVTFSLFCWVKFSTTRHQPFSAKWWTWLVMSGVSLGLVMGVKMVGLFTVATIGVAVLVELWYILDVKRTPDFRIFLNHFVARAVCLIALPIAMYLIWFWFHFKVLIFSGPGDRFMPPEFQATLEGNRLSGPSDIVVYGANLTIWHRETNVFLHSHVDTYPLEYADKRISSQGQQVTGYAHGDENNIWRLKPADPELWDVVMDPNDPLRAVCDGDLVVIEHLRTKTHLKTHDVASPLTRTNQEVTTVDQDDWITELNETVFRIEVDASQRSRVPSGEPVRLTTHAIKFQLRHELTGVALYISGGLLPEWGYKQHEVNGHKKFDYGNYWYFDDVEIQEKSPGIKIPKVESYETVPKLSLLQKTIELQSVMISQNAKLTKPHPYQSPPSFWPTVWRGISFWQDSVDRQVYLLPNPIAHWFALAMIIVYSVWWVIESVLGRRGLGSDPGFVKQFHYSGGFLLLAWGMHYLPFFIMGRSLFLHHYLPAGIIAFMIGGAQFDFMLGAVFPRMREVGWHRTAAWIVTGVLIAIVGGVFLWYSPLCYGHVGLSREKLTQMKWLSTWDFQYAG